MNTHLELLAVAVLLSGYFVWNLGMFAVAMMRSKKWRNRARLSAELQPQIRQELVSYLAGSENSPAIKAFADRSRRDVADAILSFQGTVGGGALDRLCELTIEHSLIHDWCEDARSKDPSRRRTAFERLAFVCAFEPCRRVAGDLLEKALNDPDGEVRFYAWRSLVQSGNIEEIETLFEAALSQNLLIRILLTEELRRYAVQLCERAVMWALQAPESDKVLAALEMLVAWQRAVPIPDLALLIGHTDRRIRIQAIRLAPLVPLETEDYQALIRVMVAEDADLAVEAARAFGRLRYEGALPGLARCLRSGNALLARTAAEALAQMPPLGWATLEEMSSSPNPITAGAAGEALDRAHRKASV
jgi:hypothetical protein